jgi:biopolymer transport protein TolR
MAQVGGDDEKSISVDLNLVPFIDLMSVCIVFLLLSAVWTQVSMIQIGSSIYGKRTDDEPIKPPPRAEVPLRLDVKRDGYVLILGRSTLVLPKINGEYDGTRLAAELKKAKEQYPDKTDGYVTVQDDLEYELLINGMDAMLTAGFNEVTIPTGGAK